jgi:hypothetical protein
VRRATTEALSLSQYESSLCQAVSRRVFWARAVGPVV